MRATLYHRERGELTSVNDETSLGAAAWCLSIPVNEVHHQGAEDAERQGRRARAARNTKKVRKLA
ncbi:MAG: hypothetical protein EPO20_03980 [Betaproteobacteria bacterium]|nr:MAG: hypothetical protein EPO20_03980 [Betaproteobacteria bacterium]